MSSIEQKFAKLGTDHAPGQEVRQAGDAADTPLRGDPLPGVPVDFSHGDVNQTAFGPTPGALEEFVEGVHRGGPQAYTEYRGGAELRDRVADKLARFTGRPVSSQRELIITPGTQGALFLAIGATVTAGDRVAIVRPDYFANRKLVEFLGAEIAPVRLDYLRHTDRAGLDLGQLEELFKSGVRTFLFSNPNNPAGVIYSPAEINGIAQLGATDGATVIVDELYSRLLYSGQTYAHLRAAPGADADRIVTIMGPSKTESLSGYRLGVEHAAPEPLVPTPVPRVRPPTVTFAPVVVGVSGDGPKLPVPPGSPFTFQLASVVAARAATGAPKAKRKTTDDRPRARARDRCTRAA